jgi:ribosomal-protein-alanine acetyltransferase
MKIENEAFRPPWSYDALLSEMKSDDSCFLVAINMSCRESDSSGKECVFSGTVSVSSGKESVSSKTEGRSHCVLGYAIMRRVGDDGELLKVAVDKSAKRKGVGDSLMNAILEHARTCLFNSVFLEVRMSNKSAVNLYEKHGFEVLRVRKNYYSAPPEDALAMVATL